MAHPTKVIFAGILLSILGKSVTHKGVDIFSKKGTIIHSSTNGIVLYQGQISMGGNIVLVLGPKWRLHYYAHLDSIKTNALAPVGPGSTIGTVGAKWVMQQPPHSHYTIKTLVPYPWRIDHSVQGWRKMFYLNPIPYLNEATRN